MKQRKEKINEDTGLLEPSFEERLTEGFKMMSQDFYDDCDPDVAEAYGAHNLTISPR